ncbi:hypothetical protein [Mesorhizobium retamae]|uniref:Uncharacterized protein n=1 Tax=Mesorhizobium retamae TaxID=2912854 RepID=A0ABS9QMA4_9HYPH|nr:hypothetical protein [Mesorhizobium sp. IRAMC:0171]MCG7508583.1 hypothetical protein [Mesorhizobium sp. IRAMC:0171]
MEFLYCSAPSGVRFLERTQAPLAGLQHACPKYEGYYRQEQERNGLQRFVSGQVTAFFVETGYFLLKINQIAQADRPDLEAARARFAGSRQDSTLLNG